MKKNPWLSPILLFLIPIVVFLVSLFMGRYPKPLFMPFSLLLNDDLAQRLVFSLRLPRLLCAMLLGMSLSAAGGVMQMLFRNPLVEPGFLGVTHGAGFGAALCIIFLNNSPILVETSATFFALMGLFLSWLIARRIRFGGWVLRLILSGIAVSAFFTAGLGVIKYLADPLSQLPAITFWLMGGLNAVTWKDVFYILPVVLVGLIVIILMRWRLNLLALGDETAASLGVAVKTERILLLVVSVAISAVVVGVAGIVSWIGLIIPHIARRLVGANAANFIPVCIAFGGVFGIICDDIARTMSAGEIPLGIITSLLGSLIFVGLMLSPRMRFHR